MAISITDINNRYKELTVNDLPDFIEEYIEDHRKGVQKLISSAKKKIESFEKELIRIEGMKVYENKYNDYDYICGIDEVGRGPLSGPVVCAAVILPKDCKIPYINDSKKLSESKRELLFEDIMNEAIAVSIGLSNPEVIDEINILNATKLAMTEAVEGLSVKPEVLLIDALTLPIESIIQESIIKGDEKSISIAAASIIAKVTRDHMMINYDELFPVYQFAKHKGYGTREHIEAIKAYGPCPIHRRSFIKNFV